MVFLNFQVLETLIENQKNKGREKEYVMSALATEAKQTCLLLNFKICIVILNGQISSGLRLHTNIYF